MDKFQTVSIIYLVIFFLVVFFFVFLILRHLLHLLNLLNIINSVDMNLIQIQWTLENVVDINIAANLLLAFLIQRKIHNLLDLLVQCFLLLSDYANVFFGLLDLHLSLWSNALPFIFFPLFFMKLGGKLLKKLSLLSMTTLSCSFLAYNSEHG